mmetsp:Transcript_132603/g.241267  ORF Transcript_132603/g.241267 Transcript_132603/m.241267 type:complete len:81 (-) Transcript_132603:243-485(-)
MKSLLMLLSSCNVGVRISEYTLLDTHVSQKTGLTLGQKICWRPLFSQCAHLQDEDFVEGAHLVQAMAHNHYSPSPWNNLQ